MIISWDNFVWFAVISILLWIAGTFLSFKREKGGNIIFGLGVVTYLAFIALFWNTLGRAPMRTMGETRLWYSFFISLITLILHIRWHYKFLLPFGTLLATVFTMINLLKPEIHSSILMPSLQSVWFIPHVTIYMLSYAVLAAGLISGFATLFKGPELMNPADQLTRIGTSLLLIGMLTGAIWAKQAWGTYWAWDAKENWAAVTWLIYVTYLHIRSRYPLKRNLAIATLFIAFLALQITWYGVNYFPAAKKSLHTYFE